MPRVLNSAQSGERVTSTLAFRNATAKTVELLVYGEIGEFWGGVSSKDFANQLGKHTSRRVRVSINSYGGEVFAGMAIYSQLRRHPGGCDVVVDGLAASAASLIAMAGETITMPAGSMMMIHNPMAFVVGDADEMEKQRDVLNKIRDNLVEVYAAKTGREYDDLVRLLKEETWMTAREAVDMGFADVYDDGGKVTAHVNGARAYFNGLSIATGRFNNFPASKVPAKKESDMDMEELAKAISTAVGGAIATGLSEIRAEVRGLRPDPAPEPTNTDQVKGDKPAPTVIVDLFDELSDKAIAEFGAERAQAMIEKSGGNGKLLGGLMRCARADKPKHDVPVRKEPSVEGGHDNRADSLKNMVTVMRARSVQPSGMFQADAERLRADAAKVDQNWQHRTVMDLIQVYARAYGVDTSECYRPEQVLDTVWQASKLQSQQMQVRMVDGRMYLNDSSGGLVPANLPSAFADVMHKQLLMGFERAVLPFDRLAIRKSPRDFREHTYIEITVAGVLRKLQQEDTLDETVMRELKSAFAVDEYGVLHKISRTAIVNDDLGVLARAPLELGRFYAGEENRIFSDALENGTDNDGNSVFTGDNLLQEADPFDYATHWETIRNRALATEVVPAPAGQDPRFRAGKTYALVPTVLVYGFRHERPLTVFGAQRDFNGRSFADPADQVRASYEEMLYRNRAESLYFTATEAQILYTGPESEQCPMYYGRLAGDTGPRSRVGETSIHERDGMIIRVESSFAAKYRTGLRAWKIEDNV